MKLEGTRQTSAPTGAQTGAQTSAQTSESQLMQALKETHTESGRTLLELLDQSPILLVFLRHFGCSFCRRSLDQVAGIRGELDARGVRPVFVHLGTPERAKPYFDYYKLADVERVSNVDGSLYAHPCFALPRIHPLYQLLQLAVWKAWLQSAIRKYGIGMIQEDAHQMPGLFFLRDRAIVRAFRYRTTADQPDYLKLIDK
jgi:hypothetical protein